jgi:hypothetical protein
MGANQAHPAMVNTVRCMGPNCHAVRLTANRWFVCARTSTDGAANAFICFPYEPGMPLEAHQQPVCGPGCAQKLFEKYLTRPAADKE